MDHHVSYRPGEPSWGSPSYHDHFTINPFVPSPYVTTNLAGRFSTDRGPHRSGTSQNPYGRRRTNAPTTHMHEYELGTARWQARKKSQAACRLSCSVCLEIMDPSVWIRPTALCMHEPRICEPCLTQYVEHATREEGLTEVLCPDVECRQEMAHEDVLVHIRGDPVFLNRFNELVAKRELEKHPNFVYCANPRCGKGQIHAGGVASPLVICLYCHAYFCFTHREPWHTRLTCAEYDALVKREGQNHASEQYIGIHTKRCPNPSCRRPIEKVSGCDHMTCRRPGGCGHEFCWVCLADYSLIRQQGNHNHNLGCKHYAPNPNDWATAYEPLEPTGNHRYRRTLRQISPSPPPLLERRPTPYPSGFEDY